MWTIKHKPVSFSGFAGNNKVVEAVSQWAWSKPIILHGPTGVGKTLLTELIAGTQGLELTVIEHENIKESDEIVQAGTIFGGRKLIVIEDVDRIRGTKDVANLVKLTRNPMILTTNDYKNKKLEPLKKICEPIGLSRPQPASIANHLARICHAENINASQETLKELASHVNGDVRAAVFDLENICAGRKKIGMEDLDSLYKRDRKGDIWGALGKIFGDYEIRDVVACTWDLTEQPRDVLTWIAENAPRVITQTDCLSRAYGYLSRADVFIGRIASRQYWGFLRYANPLMTAGVNVCRGKTQRARYEYPSIIIKMARSKKDRNLESSISKKMSPHLHASSNAIARDYIPLYRMLIEKGKIDAGDVKRFYRLEDEEIEYVTG